MRRPNRRPNYTETEDIINWEIAPDYLIYKDDADYIAVNGDTGKEGSRNTNLHTVMQYAVDQCGDRGTIITKGDLTLTAAVTMDDNIKIINRGKITVTTDIDAFIFDGIIGAAFEDGEIEATHATYSHSVFHITGAACEHNCIKDIIITLPASQGYGIQLVADNGDGVCSNTFETIRIVNGIRGVDIDVNAGGYININKFSDIAIWHPSAYGFYIDCAGTNYAGNMHSFVWSEINSLDNVSAFYMTGNNIGDNMFLACKGVDFGSTNSYFIKLGAYAGSANNIFIGCQGSQYLETATHLMGKWLDLGTGTTSIYYASDVIEQVFQPGKADMGSVLKVVPSGTGNTGKLALYKEDGAVAFIDFGWGAGNAEFLMYIYNGQTDVDFEFNYKGHDVAEKTVSTINTNHNHQFNYIAVPTAVPDTAEAGSLYFDTATDTLYIYTGAAWKTVTLT